METLPGAWLLQLLADVSQGEIAAEAVPPLLAGLQARIDAARGQLERGPASAKTKRLAAQVLGNYELALDAFSAWVAERRLVDRETVERFALQADRVLAVLQEFRVP
ncbi:MAG: hypothetical protein ACYCW6_18765 [Candidatus Xenobia bacterium]